MSLAGRIYNRICAVTPESIQEMYSKRYVKLHHVDQEVLNKNAEVIDMALEQALPDADRIALSHAEHKSRPLRLLQQSYNQSILHLRTLKQDMKTIETQKQQASKKYLQNPHRHFTQKSTVAMLESGLAQKQAQQTEVAAQFLQHHAEYHRALKHPSLQQACPQTSSPSQPVPQAPSVERAVEGSRFTQWLRTRRPDIHHQALTTIYEPLGDSADVLGMGNAGEPGVNLPHTPLHLAANVPTDYIGAAVAISSMEAFVSFRKEDQRLSSSINNVGELREYLGDSPQLNFLDRFLRHERKTVRFCKYVPGLSSGTSGALTVVGQYVGALSPVGLFLSAGNGIAHVGDTIRQYRHNAQALSTLQAEHKAYPQPTQDIELRHLKQERNLLLKAGMAWSGVAAGATTLGAASGAAIGLGVAHAAPVLLPVGIAVTTPSIVGATIWNNVIYGKRFTPGLSQHLELHIQELLKAARAGDRNAVERLLNTLPDEEFLERELARSETKRSITKSFRRQVLPTLKPGAVIQQKTRTVIQHVLASGSLGLLETSMANMKKITHEQVARKVDVEDALHLAALGDLRSAEFASLPETSNAASPDNPCAALLRAIEESDARVVIARLAATRIIREKATLGNPFSSSQAHTAKLVYHQSFDWLRKRDEKLNETRSMPVPALGDLLARMLTRPSETSASANAEAILQRFRALQERQSDNDEALRQVQVNIHELFKASTNEYFLYQARDEAKIQRGAATRMKTAWRQTRLARM